MKLVFSALLLTTSLFSNAQVTSVFNDRGSNYNKMNFHRILETGDNAYTIEFRNDEESYFTNFIVTSKGVVAFDPISDSAAIEYAKLIKRYAPNKPLLAIVYSHLHTDHIAGARVLRREFGPDVPIIAHKNVLEHFKNFPVSYIDLPTSLVGNDGAVFNFGNRTIELKYVGDAHTASILVPVIKELKMAYVCDFANNDVVGWTDLPGINIDEMLTMQKRVSEMDLKTITFCHGKPGTKSAIERQLEYFQAVLEAAKQAKAKGLTENQAAKTIELEQYRHFSNYDDWFEDNVRAMYRWVD